MKSTKKQTTTKFLIPMIILVIALVLGAGSVAAASENNTSQSNNSTNITTATELTQTNNTVNSAPATPADPQIWRDGAPVARGGHPVGYQYSTITEAVNDALDGDTIMLESGAVFHEQLTVGKNLTFNVLDNGQSTLNGSTFSESILTINPGVTVYLYNLIFTGGHTSLFGGAIFNRGTLTAENCTFIGNKARAEGGAIWNGMGTFALTNCTFYGNQARLGGGILTYGNSNPGSVTNCTFTDNTASEGGALNNNIKCTTTVTGCDFTGNQASYGGAIINWSTLTVNSSNLESNNGNFGGAICVWNPEILTNLHFNRIVGNTAPNGNAIYCQFSTVDATNNWWGNNTPDFSSLFTVAFGGTVNADPWMILRVTASPGTINNSETSQVTVDLLHDSTYDPANPEASYHDPSLGHVPDRLPILLNLSWGSFTDPVVIHSLTDYTLNGKVTAIFYANEGRAPTDPVRVNATINEHTTNEIESAYINIVPSTNLTVTKTGPNTVIAGNQITYTITATNNGPDDASNVAIFDTFPGISNISWNAEYSGGASGPTSGTGNLNINLGTIPIGGSCTITATGTVPSSTPADTTLINTVTITTSTQLNDQASTIDTMTTTVERESDIVLEQTVNNARPDVGNTTTFTVTARNNGPSDATDIQIQDVMPSGFNNIIVTPSKGIYNPENGIWTLNLTVGETATLTLTGKITNLLAGKNTTNTATLLGTTNQTNTTIYVPQADLYIQITSDKNGPKTGETFTLTYKLGNNGPDDATNVSITIPLPESFVISEIRGDGNWTITGNTITWTFNNVTVGDPYLYITGRISQPENYLFNAFITSETFNINSRRVNSLNINTIPQVSAATNSNTIGMQNTGTPLTGIYLAILMVLGGFIGTKKGNK